MAGSVNRIRVIVVGKATRDNQTMFKIVECLYEVKPATRVAGCNIVGNWRFRKSLIDERELITVMRNGTLVANAIVKNVNGTNKVVGNHGDFNRFKTGYELVIISELKYAGEDRTLGYKVADSNGNIKNVKKNDLISLCIKYRSKGIEFPIQNASFVNKGDGTYLIRRNTSAGNSNDDGGILVEYMEREVNKNVVKVTPEQQRKEKEQLDKNARKENLRKIFTDEQIRLLANTRKKNRNWKLIANPKLSVEQMRILADGLDKKTNISLINKPEFKPECMEIYIDDMTYGNDISKYLNPKYDEYQLSELGIAYASGLDLSKMSNPSLSNQEMAEIRIRLENDIWDSHYAVDIDGFTEG